MFDGIIVGGGHAGIEAALAMAKINRRVLLITGDLSKVASLPCNPSIGGPAKGIVVREIDALGGQMGKSVDLCQIQMKMLNASKGPAVRALRAQVDKLEYPKVMLEVLKNTPNLELLESFVDKIIIENNVANGVILEDGTEIFSKTVILTTGTYLDSKILVGLESHVSGPDGDKTTSGISNQLREFGFTMTRLKTGTPPRIEKSTIDYSKTVEQPGETLVRSFSHDSDILEYEHNVSCYLSHTSPLTHKIIADNLTKSAMYGGAVEGIGPRYCPSIEDKIVRFADKERHQIFFEPEGMELDTMYILGLSTSMPREVQDELVASIPGLEKAKIIKYAYAIEYDAIDPIQLQHSLETKLIKNLFCAGQINGTSGYEEAAGQGIIAGINAARKNLNSAPLILRRDEAYIGVLIDDLITKGTKEPYRLLTSRAEYRLLLRNDNADLRLRQYGRDVGLIDSPTYAKFIFRKEQISTLMNLTLEIRINPTEKNNQYLTSIGSSIIYEGVILHDLIKRPEFNIDHLIYFIGDDYDKTVIEQVIIQIKYEGYIKKAILQADKMIRLEEKVIPSNIDYTKVKNLSYEAREKLLKIFPRTIGQATRILGVNPADIALIMVHIEAGL